MLSSIRLLLPETILSAGALLLLGWEAFAPRKVKGPAFILGILTILAALCAVSRLPEAGVAFGMVRVDFFSSFFKMLALLSALLILLLSEKDEGLMAKQAGTYIALLLLSVVGVLFLSGAEDLLILFVGLELTTVPLFVLAGFLRNEVKSSEGAIKFFLIGAFSSALMVYGISLLYGISGGTHFEVLKNWLLGSSGDRTLFLLGIFFLLVGLGFKLSLVPFHQWTPDAYEGAPTPVTAFFSISREAGVIVVMLRLFGSFLPSSALGLGDFFLALSVLTMMVGNLAALRQTNLKRLLAFSSVAHAGTIFIGLVAGNLLGRQGVMIYGLAYSLMSIGAFACVIYVSRLKGSDDLSAIQGLARENFGVALLMLFFLLSLAGVPPFLGFLGKFYVFAAAIESKQYGLVAIGLVNSLIAVYYYFRVVHAMFFQDPLPGEAPVQKQFSLQLATLACAAFVLLLGIFPESLFSWVKGASLFLP